MMPSICHQLSNSRMFQWKIAVRLSNSVEFWYKDRHIIIFMARGCDVRVEGGTLTQITRLLIDLFEMSKETYPSVFRSASLSFIFSPPSGSLTLGLLRQFTPDFPRRSDQRGDSIVFCFFLSNLLGYWSGVSALLGFY